MDKGVLMESWNNELSATLAKLTENAIEKKFYGKWVHRKGVRN